MLNDCATATGSPTRGLTPKNPMPRIALRTRGTLAPTSAAIHAMSGLALAWQKWTFCSVN